MPPAVSCPDRAVLERLLLGQLSSTDEAGVGGHVQGCAMCRATLVDLLADDTVVEAIRSRETPGAGKQADFVLQLIASLRSAPKRPPPVPAVSLPGAEAPTFFAPSGSMEEIGRVGDYRLLRLLGHGGMGMVYEAEDIRLKRRVALKVMKPEMAAHDDARLRFLREAQAAAKVKSDHIVTIYQVGEDNGAPYLAMEFLHGEAMDHWLKRGMRPNIVQVLKMGREIALGLAAAHERGLVHRDIKPGNIWLEAPTGRIKILDFGLARAAHDDVQLTRSGAIVGTPAYMSPEQAQGQPVDHRTDLFSLGCVLYRLTTGRMPFRGESTMAILSALAVAQPKPVRVHSPQVPQPLADLIERLLAKDPAQRPTKARSVVQALESIKHAIAGAGTPLPALPISIPVATAVAEPTQTAPVPIALPVSSSSPVQTATSPIVAARARRPRRRRMVAGLAALVATCLVLWLLYAHFHGKNAIAPDDDRPPSLYAVVIPPEERFDWQPPGLVAVLGDHRVRHAGQISLMALSPDGKWVATVYSNQLFVSNTETLHVEEKLSSEGLGIISIAWSGDGKTLAAGRSDERGVVQIWDAPSWQLRKELLLGKSPQVALALTPDGRRLATAGRDEKTVTLWDIESGAKTQQYVGYPSTIRAITFTAEGSELLVAGGPSTGGSFKPPECAVWSFDSASGKKLASMEGPSKVVVALLASDDGKKILAGTEGELFALGHAGEKPVRLAVSNNVPWSYIALRKDGQYAVTAQNSEQTYWELSPTLRNLEPHTWPEAIGGLTFLPDNRRVLAAVGATLRIWIPKQPALKREDRKLFHAKAISGLALSSDGRRLLSSSEDGTTCIWDFPWHAGPNLIRRIAAPSVQQQTVFFRDDKKILFVDQRNGASDTWHLVELKDNRELLSKKFPGVAAGLPMLTFIPDGKGFIVPSEKEGNPVHYKMDNANPTPWLKGHPEPIAHCVFCDEGKKLFTVTTNGIARLWDMTEVPKVLRQMDISGNYPVISPDGRRLYLGGANQWVRTLDLTEDKAVPIEMGVKYHNAPIYRLAVSPDGRVLASSDNDGRVVVWDTVERDRMFEWRQPTGPVGQLLFTPDNRHLITGNGDGTIYIISLDAR